MDQTKKPPMKDGLLGLGPSPQTFGFTAPLMHSGKTWTGGRPGHVAGSPVCRSNRWVTVFDMIYSMNIDLSKVCKEQIKTDNRRSYASNSNISLMQLLLSQNSPLSTNRSKVISNQGEKREANRSRIVQGRDSRKS
uniref:Uncharacterized protein n=1 Tax=Oryza rufipogon TaxID=4529 RepID=A0A0E0Q0K8_ORYRU